MRTELHEKAVIVIQKYARSYITRRALERYYPPNASAKKSRKKGKRNPGVQKRAPQTSSVRVQMGMAPAPRVIRRFDRGTTQAGSQLSNAKPGNR